MVTPQIAAAAADAPVECRPAPVAWKSLPQADYISPTLALIRLQGPFDRLALVSQERHVEALRPAENTLVVCCDWLLWQRTRARGFASICLEAGLLDWNDRTIDSDIYLRSTDWVYVDGTDVTRFRGVSLGKQFAREASLVIVSYLRIERALETLIKRFSPRSIVLYDCLTEIGDLDTESACALVADIARRHGVLFEDRRNPIDDSAVVSGVERARYRSVQGTGRSWRNRLRQAYEHLVGTVSLMWTRIGRRRPAVMLVIGDKLARPLVAAFSSTSVVPIFPAGTMPKSVRFVAGALLRGLRLFGVPVDRLRDSERAEIDRICARLLAAESSSATGLDLAVRRAIRLRVLATGRLHEMARQTVRIHRVLDAWGPAALVTDSVVNPPARIFLEAARARGIKTFFTWHSVAVQNLKFDALGCDERSPSAVSGCLTWGRVNEEWLDKIGAKARIERVGSLLPIRASAPTRAASVAHGRSRVVVLQHNQVLVDSKAFASTQFSYFIEVVRMLERLGCREIVYKLHPGIWSVAYHEEIVRRYGLRCRVVKSAPLGDLIDWCDFAVGPITSGAMLEFLASGKPYYGLLLPPHAIDTSYFRRAHVMTEVAQLEDFIDHGRYLNAEDLLEDFCAFREFPDPQSAVWRALERAVGGQADTVRT